MIQNRHQKNFNAARIYHFIMLFSGTFHPFDLNFLESFLHSSVFLNLPPVNDRVTVMFSWPYFLIKMFTTRYDSVPEELRFIETRPGEEEGNLDTTQSSSRLTPVATLTGGSPARSTAILGALSCYMYNQRWVWKMSCNGKSLSNSAVSGVLYALTKYDILLSSPFILEGYS